MKENPWLSMYKPSKGEGPTIIMVEGANNDPTYGAKVYIMNNEGQVKVYEGSTLPNPYRPNNPEITGTDAYPTVRSGIYPYSVGLHQDTYKAIRVNSGNPVPTTAPNPNNKDQLSQAEGINVHKGQKSDWRGSAGCFTIKREQWDDFIRQFKNEDKGTIYVYR